MQIRYTIGLEYLQAYHDEIRSALPGFYRIRCLQSVGGPLFLLFFVWLMTHFEYGWWPTLSGIIPALLVGFYLWSQSPGLWVRANLDGMHREGKLDGHLGEHLLEVSDNGVIERNEAGEHLSHWPEIENIYSTTQRTFFVTKCRVGYVLPKSSVVEGDYDEFVRTAVLKWKSA